MPSIATSEKQIDREREFGIYSQTPYAEADWEQRLSILGLHLNHPELVIICRECKYALQASGECVSKHLGEKHGISLRLRRGLRKYVDSLQLPDPNTVDARPDGSEPHEHLATQTGAECAICRFRSTSLDVLHRHLSKAHGHKAYRRHWASDRLHDGLSLQSWTQNGSRTYWTVTSPSPARPPIVIDGTPRRRKKMHALHLEEEQRLTGEVVSQTVTDPGVEDLAFMSNWIRRTNWAQLFDGVDRQGLIQLAELPSAHDPGLKIGHHQNHVVRSCLEDEQKLQTLGHAVDLFLDRCEDTARNTDHSIRCWLRSHLSHRPYKAPFQLPGREGTRQRYHMLWKKLFYFVVRFYRLDEQYRTEALGRKLSRAQRTAIEKVWRMLGENPAEPISHTRSDIHQRPSCSLPDLEEDLFGAFPEPESSHDDSPYRVRPSVGHKDPNYQSSCVPKIFSQGLSSTEASDEDSHPEHLININLQARGVEGGDSNYVEEETDNDGDDSDDGDEGDEGDEGDCRLACKASRSM